MQFSNIFDLTSRFQLLVAGYETLQLHSLQQPLEPGQGYSLPEWAQGGWGDSFSVDGGTVTYDRASDFTRYSMLQRYLPPKIKNPLHQNSKIITTKIETADQVHLAHGLLPALQPLPRPRPHLLLVASLLMSRSSSQVLSWAFFSGLI